MAVDKRSVKAPATEHVDEASAQSRIVRLKPSDGKKAGTNLEFFIAGLDLILVLVCDLLVEVVPAMLVKPVIILWAVLFVVVNFVVRR